MSGGRVVTVDAAAGVVSLSSAVILNDGVESTTITVRCINTDGKPMQGLAAARVSVSSTGTGNAIAALSGVTDRNGDISTTMTSTVGESKTISATVLSAAVTDTATLSVLNTFAPNQPAWATGSELVLDSDFATDPLLNGNVANADLLTVGIDNQAGIPNGDPRTDCNRTDLTAPFSTAVYAYDYPGNDAGNGVGTIAGRLLGPATMSAKRLYTSFSVYFSEGYVTHTNTGTEKLWYPLGTVDSSFGIAIPSGGTAAGPLVFSMGTQTGIGPSVNVQPSGTQTQKGVWNLVEVEMHQNSGASTTDGVLRVWLNGEQVWELTNLNYGGTAASPVWTTPRWSSVRGGGASTVLTPPGGQTRKFSRLAVYASGTL